MNLTKTRVQFWYGCGFRADVHALAREQVNRGIILNLDFISLTFSFFSSAQQFRTKSPQDKLAQNQLRYSKK